MNRRCVLLGLALAAGAVWWILHDDAEAKVQEAHQELVRLLSKTGDESATPSVLDVLAYQSMFANSCEVSGEADAFVGSYSPQEMASLIVQVRALFQQIELRFSEPIIEFPTAEQAIASFTADLTAAREVGELEQVRETRSVTSRLRRVDGRWVFEAFQFER